MDEESLFAVSRNQNDVTESLVSPEHVKTLRKNGRSAVRFGINVSFDRNREMGFGPLVIFSCVHDES